MRRRVVSAVGELAVFLLLAGAVISGKLEIGNLQAQNRALQSQVTINHAISTVKFNALLADDAHMEAQLNALLARK